MTEEHSTPSEGIYFFFLQKQGLFEDKLKIALKVTLGFNLPCDVASYMMRRKFLQALNKPIII